MLTTLVRSACRHLRRRPGWIEEHRANRREADRDAGQNTDQRRIRHLHKRSRDGKKRCAAPYSTCRDREPCNHQSVERHFPPLQEAERRSVFAMCVLAAMHAC